MFHFAELLIVKRDSSTGVFVVLLLKYNFCLRNIYVFHRSIRPLPDFKCKKTFDTSVVLLCTMASMQLRLLQTNSSFPMRLSESKETFDLGQICRNSEIQLTVHLFSDKARCFSLSERALYGNFTLKILEKIQNC